VIEEQFYSSLKFVVPNSVDKWVEAAVDKNGNDTEVIQRTGKINFDSEIIEQEDKLVAGKTQDKTSRDSNQSLQYVTLCHSVRCRRR
jgi:hypothetical protein